MKKTSKSYPSAGRSRTARTDNYLWINGANGLAQTIYMKCNSIEQEITTAENRLDSIRSKTVKGKNYLYEWVENSWEYLGRENPGHDIRVKIVAEIKKLKADKEKVKDHEEKIIVKRVGDHLIVSKRHKAARDIIKISSLVIRSAPAAGPAARITKGAK